MDKRQEMSQETMSDISSQSDMFVSQCASEGEMNKDPYALDPCFQSEAEMTQYLKSIGQVSTIITEDDLEVEKEQGEESRHCDCGECGSESDSKELSYLCCNQRFPSWKVDLGDDVGVTCITHCEAFHASVNKFTVMNGNFFV